MLRYIVSFFSLLLILLFIACSSDDSSSNPPPNPPPISSNEGTAQLGNLAGAEVKIFKVEDNGSYTLKWTETTSGNDGSGLGSIGKFNLHDAEFSPSSYYLYQVSGGEDWDKEDDGILDDNATINNGVIRSVVKGGDVQAAGELFRVTFASELLYEKVAKSIKYNFDPAGFDALLTEKAQTIVEDIDGDGSVTTKDIIIFNPVNDKEKMTDLYALKNAEIIDLIHQGKTPL